MSTNTPTQQPAAAPGPAQYIPMGLEDALVHLKRGQHIRRRSWPLSQFLVLDLAYRWPDEDKPSTGNIMVMVAGTKSYMAMSNRDILAKDWEIVE